MSDSYEFATHTFEPYRCIAERNKGDRFDLPIYVGEAVPRGARKGGFGLNTAPGRVLYRRLVEHAQTVQSASKLNADDFLCRYMVWMTFGYRWASHF